MTRDEFNDTEWKEGMRVLHNTYGKGHVVSVSNNVLKVRFGRSIGLVNVFPENIELIRRKRNK